MPRQKRHFDTESNYVTFLQAKVRELKCTLTHGEVLAGHVLHVLLQAEDEPVNVRDRPAVICQGFKVLVRGLAESHGILPGKASVIHAPGVIAALRLFSEALLVQVPQPLLQPCHDPESGMEVRRA